MIQTLLNGVAANANQKSINIPCNAQSVSLWAKGTTLNAADSTIILQGSNKDTADDTDWFDLSETSITLAATATAYGSSSTKCPFAFVRASYAKNSVTTGTIEAIININY